MEHVEMTLQLEDGLLVGSRYDWSSKAAKRKEARQLSKELQGCHSLSKRRKLDSDHIDEWRLNPVACSFCRVENNSCPYQFWFQPSLQSQHCIPILPAIASISTRKGEARISLFELCKVMQWPMPTFKITEQKSRTPIEFGEGSEKRRGFNSYAWELSLQIPNFGTIVCRGDPRADKKSSYDSAVVALYKLQRQGKLTIGCS